MGAQQALNILTVNSEILHGNGVVVVDSLLLGYDMLIGMDIIRMLGGVCINQSGDATFSRMELCACAAIEIEELDLGTEFDEKTRVLDCIMEMVR